MATPFYLEVDDAQGDAIAPIWLMRINSFIQFLSFKYMYKLNDGYII